MADLVLKWYWRYHVLGVEEFDDLDEACSSAEYLSDAGEEALDHIEVIHDDGTTDILSVEDVRERTRPERMARDAAYRAAPKPTRKLTITYGDKSAVLGWFSDVGEAEREYARLGRRLGADRIRLESL